jgi:hypothetical protein
MMLTIHLQLVPRSRIYGSIHTLPIRLHGVVIKHRGAALLFAWHLYLSVNQVVFIFYLRFSDYNCVIISRVHRTVCDLIALIRGLFREYEKFGCMSALYFCLPVTFSHDL